MMLLPEALVIFACVNSSGCTETSDQYLVIHPEVKKYMDKEGQDLRKMIGPQFVDTVGPVLFVMVGGTGVIHITRDFNLQVAKDKGTLTYTWGF